MQLILLFHSLVAQMWKAIAVQTLLHFYLQAGAYCKGYIVAGHSLQLQSPEENRWW